jgi:hypothetical protein
LLQRSYLETKRSLSFVNENEGEEEELVVLSEREELIVMSDKEDKNKLCYYTYTFIKQYLVNAINTNTFTFVQYQHDKMTIETQYNRNTKS